MGVLDGEVAIMTGAECRRGAQRATTVVLAASEADVKVAGREYGRYLKNLLKDSGFELETGCRMSLTSTAMILSQDQSSWPLNPSSAEKKTRVPSTASWLGFELPGPALMSAIWIVPPDVPSLIQSSVPVPLVAEKKSIPP